MSTAGESDPGGPLDRTVDGPNSKNAALQKLRQTAREAEALASSLEHVPDELIWQRPGESPSIAELLWLIHLADEFRFRPVADSIIHGYEPRVEHVNAPVLLGTDPAPDDDLAGILDQVIESREKLLDRLEQIPAGAWSVGSVVEVGVEVTCARFAEDIARHDVEILREIGQRLMESSMG